MIHKITLSIKYNYRLKCSDTQLNEYSFKVPKVVKTANKKTLLKTLGTSVINTPLSPFFLVRLIMRGQLLWKSFSILRNTFIIIPYFYIYLYTFTFMDYGMGKLNIQQNFPEFKSKISKIYKTFGRFSKQSFIVRN